MQTSVKLGVSQ